MAEWDGSSPREILGDAVRNVGEGAIQMASGLAVLVLFVLITSPAWGLAYLLISR